MFAEGRREVIQRRLARDGQVSVADLAREWAVSAMTVRRDLQLLEDQGRLRRTYGGAVPIHLDEIPVGPRVGLLLPHREDSGGDIVGGAEQAADRLGCRLVLAAHLDDPQLEQRRLAELAGLALDGLIVASTEPASIAPRIVRAWRRPQVPTVLVDQEPPAPWTAAGPDAVRAAHDCGAELAVEHLHALGHRRLLTLLAPTPIGAALRHGIGVAATRCGMGWTDHRCPDLTAASATAVRAAHRCLDEGIRAVLVHTDVQALALCSALAERDLRVPADVHVISYDGQLAATAPVPLTAVTPPRRELGFEAVRLLLQRLESGPGTAARQLILLPRLTIRSSAPATR